MLRTSCDAYVGTSVARAMLIGVDFRGNKHINTRTFETQNTHGHSAVQIDNQPITTQHRREHWKSVYGQNQRVRRYKPVQWFVWETYEAEERSRVLFDFDFDSVSSFFFYAVTSVAGTNILFGPTLQSPARLVLDVAFAQNCSCSQHVAVSEQNFCWMLEQSPMLDLCICQLRFWVLRWTWARILARHSMGEVDLTYTHARTRTEKKGFSSAVQFNCSMVQFKSEGGVWGWDEIKLQVREKVIYW